MNQKQSYLLTNKPKAFVWTVAFIRLSQNRIERFSSSPVIAGRASGHNKCGDINLHKQKPEQLEVCVCGDLYVRLKPSYEYCSSYLSIH